MPADDPQATPPRVLHHCTPECPPSHREHLNHMTDGRWHDDCKFCIRRRAEGGNGLEGEEVPDAS